MNRAEWIQVVKRVRVVPDLADAIDILVAALRVHNEQQSRDTLQRVLAAKHTEYQRGLVDGTDKMRRDIRDILCIKEDS